MTRTLWLPVPPQKPTLERSSHGKTANKKNSKSGFVYFQQQYGTAVHRDSRLKNEIMFERMYNTARALRQAKLVVSPREREWRAAERGRGREGGAGSEQLMLWELLAERAIYFIFLSCRNAKPSAMSAAAPAFIHLNSSASLVQLWLPEASATKGTLLVTASRSGVKEPPLPRR